MLEIIGKANTREDLRFLKVEVAETGELEIKLQGILDYIDEVIEPSFISLTSRKEEQAVETPNEDLEMLSMIEEDLEKANHQCD